MTEPQKKHKLIFVITTFGFIFALVLIVFVIYPQIQEILKQINEIKEQKIKIEELNQKKRNIDKLKNEDQKHLEQMTKELDTSLVSSDEILNLVIKLEEIAKKTNVTSQLQIHEKQKSKTPTSQEETEETTNEIEARQKNKPQKPQNALSNLPHLSASIILTGEFKDILRYLLYLENLSYKTQIKSLRINTQSAASYSLTVPQPPKEAPSEKGVNATLEIDIFIKD